MLVYLQMMDDRRRRGKFERVHERYAGIMYAAAYRILNNAQDAEDAVHEAFCAIAKNIKKISDADSNKTRAYVVIITENKAKDIYRANKRRGAAGFDEAFMGEPFPAPGDGGIADAIARLPARYRNVLYLKHSCGYKSREIGEMLDMSAGMVRQELMKAKEALRKELEKEGIEV